MKVLQVLERVENVINMEGGEMHIPQTAHKNKKQSGLTFIELSISVLLISILATAITYFYSSIYKYTKTEETEDRLDVVQQALNNYVLLYGRLPCPADPTLDVDDSSFGFQDDSNPTNDTCDGLSNSDNIFFGAVPTKTLNLSNKYALDGWGNKVSYFVRGEFATDEDTFKGTAYNYEESSHYAIDILSNGTSGSTSEDYAVYALVSHGYNGRGAYTNDGGQILFTTKTGEQTTDESYLSENTNRYNSSGFDKVIVQDLYDQNFDDIIRFSSKSNLIYDAGWEGIGCIGDEVDDTEYSVGGTDFEWSGTTPVLEGEGLNSDTACSAPAINYVSLNDDNLNKPERVCGPYGQWSNVVYECVPGCSVTISSTTYYIGVGDSIYEACPEGEVGEIIYTCESAGTTSTSTNCE